MAGRDKEAVESVVVGWQGWRLRVPEAWGPVKLEGDLSAGAAVFADLEGKRLEMRWITPHRRSDRNALMRKEVGELAAREAEAFPLERWESSLLFLEPEPPGRDVWLGKGAASGRILTLAYNCRRRDRLLPDQLLRSLDEQPPDAPMLWSVFGLSCIAPTGFRLRSHRLNAGDLTLSFARFREWIDVRQVAIASLALRRMPLERWVAEQQRRRPEYKSSIESREVAVDLRGQSIPGLLATTRRRRRYMLLRSLPPVLVTVAVHDVERDRLVLVEASSEELARRVAATIGCAATEAPQPCRC